MNNIICSIRERAKSQIKTIVLPEYEERRIKEAAEFIEKEGIARVLLLSPESIKKELIDKFTLEFADLRKDKGMTIDEAREIVSNPLYYSAMMVRNNLADGFVAGATYTTSDVARTAIRCIGVNPEMKFASSCFIMILPESICGEKRVFVFADCGIVLEPDSLQLAWIALSSAKLAQNVLGIVPRVALLSYSTKGSSQGKSVRKIREAVQIITQLEPNMLVDGEIQADAAIIPEVGKIKGAGDILGGKANVLIFPDLNSGNISYKLVQRLANARAIGPIMLGLNHPCSDLSRGCLVEDIMDCVAVTAVNAQMCNVLSC